ncbi:hypothetical protein CLOM_g2885 [Closterium sp. NIES-68]|nr:hypothetical protein CLOM_g2885 [Closterium sp. NIES-68]GJP69462.1 hypothetical protein CLOP_g475 [Closterium sp. NIES-67]GJP75745.1 hypothetical protein CLOP_g6151 [Closterium sp. NIES-67]
MARSHTYAVISLALAALCLVALASAAGTPTTPAPATKTTPAPAGKTPAPAGKTPARKPRKHTPSKINQGVFNKWDGGYIATISPSEGGLAQGACGYGTTVNTPIGYATSAVSSVLYEDGQTCGACVAIQCVKNKKCNGKLTTVTVTNHCKGNRTHGGLCMLPKKSIMLPPTVYDQIVTSRDAGDISVRAMRVPCPRKGGIQVKVLMGNDWFINLLPLNVAGPGTISKAEAQLIGSGGFKPLTRNFGTTWSLNGIKVGGKALTLRLTSNFNGKVVVLKNVIPASWQVNQTYGGEDNFPDS